MVNGREHRHAKKFRQAHPHRFVDDHPGDNTMLLCRVDCRTIRPWADPSANAHPAGNLYLDPYPDDYGNVDTQPAAYQCSQHAYAHPHQHGHQHCHADPHRDQHICTYSNSTQPYSACDRNSHPNADTIPILNQYPDADCHQSTPTHRHVHPAAHRYLRACHDHGTCDKYPTGWTNGDPFANRQLKAPLP